MAPILLKSKVIVIDDIERKHANLGIDEVLGLIDEYSKQYDSRFILVLNDDQIAIGDENQAALWNAFREKVIDHEVKLTTTPKEAFGIAINIVESKYQEALEHANAICRVTNIRIIIKTIKLANKILAKHSISDSIQARVIPSIVLFSAIYYRGMEPGFDFKFALTGGLARGIGLNNTKDAEDHRAVGWRTILQELGIYSCDDFESMLVDYFESGIFEEEKVKTIISRYQTESEKIRAHEIANKFLHEFYWDHTVSEEKLVANGRSLPEIAQFLDAFQVSEIGKCLQELPDGEDAAQLVIGNWIASFKERNPEGKEVELRNFFHRPLHPHIQAAFVDINSQVQANTSVKDACMHIIETDGWGTTQEVTLRNATTDDFDWAIRNIEIDKLPYFLQRMLQMSLQKETYESHFGSATSRFVEACKNIVNDGDSTRLSKVIKRVFKGTALEEEILQVTIKTTKPRKPKVE